MVVQGRGEALALQEGIQVEKCGLYDDVKSASIHGYTDRSRLKDGLLQPSS